MDQNPPETTESIGRASERPKLDPAIRFGLAGAGVFFAGAFVLAIQIVPWSVVEEFFSDPVNLTMLASVAGLLVLMASALNYIFHRGYQLTIGGRGIFGTLVGVEGPSELSQLNLPKLEEQISSLRETISNRAVSLSPQVQDEILSLYREALDDKFTSSISNELRLLVGQTFKRDVELQAEKFLTDINRRLTSASSTVSARGFLNLILGILSAGGALYILQQAISVLSPESINSLPMSTVIYLMGTRISIALIITLVSYFFLSLYKKSLEDAKFYQNEMTDISSKAAGLQLAYYDGDRELRAFVLSRLMESDRNRSISRVQQPTENNLTSRIAEKLVDKIPSIKPAT